MTHDASGRTDRPLPDAIGERPVVAVSDLRQGQVAEAVALLARAFRDTPINLVAFGGEPQWRLRCLQRTFSGLFRVARSQRPLVAVHGSTIVGVSGVAPPGTCQLRAAQQIGLVPSLLTIGPGPLLRVGRWTRAWSSLDPEVPHSHLGPLGVDAHLKGRGIGSQILEEYCRRLDEAHEVGYLETDAEANVRLYLRFGFEVIHEREVLGIPNWFMLRGAR